MVCEQFFESTMTASTFNHNINYDVHDNVIRLPHFLNDNDIGDANENQVANRSNDSITHNTQRVVLPNHLRLEQPKLFDDVFIPCISMIILCLAPQLFLYVFFCIRMILLKPF